jgi:hypothetical protein
MLPEYDFTGGVRGKHYEAMRKGTRSRSIKRTDQR